jgi:uncharacterized protein YkwD
MRRLALFSAALWLAACAVLPGEEKKDPAKVEPTAAEKAVVELTNKERAKENLPLLRINPVLCQVARAHAENMAKTGKLADVLDGKSTADRLKDAGYNAGASTQNIAQGDAKYLPEEVLKTWMSMEATRRGILADRITEIGVGIASNGKGEIYYAQLLAAPR